ncbi:MAG: hypothetical protein EU547_04540 [Promethearchaeota archaeon]|nr:MAG: hypothetical protein EU547_04540 [Candidatus Lokiarchaeota archaeon]
MYKTILDLYPMDVFRAICTLIFVIISLLVGLRILLKYFQHKRKELITVGLTWIFVSSPWWPLAFGFISILFFNYLFDPVIYLLLMNGFSAFGVFTWIYSITELTYPNLKKLLVSIYGIICGVYEVILLTLLFIDYRYIATKGANFDGFSYSRTLFPNLFYIFVVLTIVITAFFFCIQSIKSENPTVQWKGRFLLLGFITFIIASAFEIFSAGFKLLQAIIRIILIFAAIEYYLGFFLPDWLKRILIKGENS